MDKYKYMTPHNNPTRYVKEVKKKNRGRFYLSLLPITGYS